MEVGLDRRAQLRAADARYKAKKRAAEKRAPKQPRSQVEKREAWRRSAKKTRDVKRRLMLQFKSRPCTDCGHRYDPVCMDWDHLPQHDKLFTISRASLEMTLEEVLEEIAKCDLVCANCHRLRTKHRTSS